MTPDSIALPDSASRAVPRTICPRAGGARQARNVRLRVRRRIMRGSAPAGRTCRRIRALRQLHQNGPFLDGCPRLDAHGADDPGALGPELVFHFHRLHDNHRRARLNRIAHLHAYADDHPGHRRDERRGPGPLLSLSGQVSNGPRAFVEGLDLVSMPIDPKDELTPPGAPLHNDAVHLVADRQDLHRRSPDVSEVGAGMNVADTDVITIDCDVEAIAIHRHDVSHSVSGTSSQSVSTWAVCGNMS